MVNQTKVASLEQIWQQFLSSHRPEILRQRPSFRYDPNVYAKKINQEREITDPAKHYQLYGLPFSNAPNKYRNTHKTASLRSAIRSITIDPQLEALLSKNKEDIYELIFELLILDDPIISEISNFSSDTYLQLNQDVRESGMRPILHYLLFGYDEKRPWTKVHNRNQFLQGDRKPNPTKTYCFVLLRSLDRSGAPIIGEKIVEKASDRHNVVVFCSAHEGGPLLGPILKNACAVFTGRLNFEKVYSDLNIRREDVEVTILNSIQNSSDTTIVAQARLPFVVYVHEYIDYMQINDCAHVLWYANIVAFVSESARASWRGMMSDYGFDADRDSIIVRNAEFNPDTVSTYDKVRSRKHVALVLGRSLSDEKIIYGCGFIQGRKGVDIFLLTALGVLRHDTKAIFIWIGDGLSRYEYKSSVWTSIILERLKAKYPDRFFLIPTGAHYIDICKSADIFYCPSLLDPLPNVVFEALHCGNQVVLFEGATGFDDEAYCNEELINFVPFGDVSAAQDVILGLESKTVAAGQKVKESIFHHSDKAFTEISNALARSVARGKEPAVLRSEFKFAGNEEGKLPLLDVIWSHDRLVYWQSVDQVKSHLAKSENWIHKEINIAKFSWRNDASNRDIIIHFHAYYVEGLDDIFRKFQVFEQAGKVVITTDTKAKAETILHMVQGLDFSGETCVRIVENQGRDIVPLFRIVDEFSTSDEDLWLHLHNKKSVHSAEGDIWKNYIFRILLGDATRTSNALEIAKNLNIGLVAPFDPNCVGWSKNRRLLKGVESYFPDQFPDHPLLFPVGNMFLARSSVIREMASIFGPNYVYQNEPLDIDGSDLHLIERLWPAVVAKLGLKSAFVVKKSQRRS